MLIGVALNYVVPERVFVYVTSISLVGSLWTWALIVIAHLGYRKAVAAGEARPVAYRMPGRLTRTGSWWRSSSWSRHS